MSIEEYEEVIEEWADGMNIRQQLDNLSSSVISVIELIKRLNLAIEYMKDEEKLYYAVTLTLIREKIKVT